MQKKTISIGSIVTILDMDLEETSTYTIVSTKKREDDLSADSVLGKTLIGKEEGDIVKVKAGEEYEVEILEVDNSNVVEVAKPAPKVYEQGSLIRNIYRSYGTRAQDIYDEFCKKYGWDYTKRYAFGMMQLLYAKGVTPEGYSPWFLSHNNWTETKGGIWFNYIFEEEIKEMWVGEVYGLHEDKTTRVTFAKRKSGEYVFLGLYVPVKIEEKVVASDMKDRKGAILKKAGSTVWIKTYKLISETYPQ